ncbi:hypothetical protein D9611_005385 [Ephemerocybe angulata]|uniref:Uncharacterized protein n=1 Tax=Ephemerocybe angulata TaxID=980116 RepID=A0A8H5FDL3_9AGAR|nr:hypothetical protein D9611_005385 [Tulosesus angulatus]
MNSQQIYASELAATEHVHAQLADYSRTHYTRNYEEVTLEWLSEFIDELHPAPLTAPTDPVLPADPYTILLKSKAFESLEPYDETPETTQEAVVLIKSVYMQGNGTPRSRKHTTSLGKGLYKESVPDGMASLKTAFLSGPLDVEEVEEPPLPFDELLNVTWDVPNNDQLRAVLEPILKQHKGDCDQTSIHHLPDLEDDLTMDVLEMPFVPLFPRVKEPGRGECEERRDTIDWNTIGESVVPPAPVPSSDDDLPLQSMRLVDGWQAICSSPTSSSDSPGPSEEDMVDELCFPSTPDTDPPIVEEAERVKLDVPVFPRSRLVGGKKGVQPHILKDKKIETFLPALLPKDTELPKVGPNIVTPSSPATTSMLGCASGVDEALSVPNPDDHLDLELGRLYKDMDPFSMILDETIDEKDVALMEVPNLPEPTEHAHPHWIPTSFAALTTPVSVAEGEVPRPFLRKATMHQSITVSLSWAAFTVSEKLPSLPQILDIETPLLTRDLELQASMMQDVERLLGVCAIIDHTDRPVTMQASSPYLAILSGDDVPENPFKEPSVLLLSRLDRQRSGLKSEVDDTLDDKLDELEADIENEARSPVLHEFADQQGVETKPDFGFYGAGYPTGRLEAKGSSNSRPPASSPKTSGVAEPIPEPYDEQGKENWDPSSDLAGDFLDDEYRDDLNDAGADGSDNPFFYDPEDLYRQPQIPFDLPAEMDDDDVDGVDPRGSEAQQSWQSYSLDRHVDQADSQPTPLAPPPAEDDLLVHGKPNTKGNNLQDVLMGSVTESRQTKDDFFALNTSYAKQMPFKHSAVLEFAHLRSVKLPEPTVQTEAQPVAAEKAHQDLNVTQEMQTVPPEIIDGNTIAIEDALEHMPSSTVHRYLASLSVIQKRALVKSLASNECLVDLFERANLGDVDMILDCSTAVIFVPLFTLASECASWIEKISAQSWTFNWIYVILEAYPASCAYKFLEKPSTLYAYSPPILKAIKKLRRDIGIAEAFNNKSGDCRVIFAFADRVADAARFVRYVGNLAEARDTTNGAIWGEREWLEEEHEDESDLACVAGLNHFSAALILSQVGVEDFLKMSPQERMSYFGLYIGATAVATVNDDIERRHQRVSEAVSSGDDVPYHEEASPGMYH